MEVGFKPGLDSKAPAFPTDTILYMQLSSLRESRSLLALLCLDPRP